ncbi:MAG TPA: hypothetical protein VI814_02590 [Candidatus Limnocylindria bacterium]
MENEQNDDIDLLTFEEGLTGHPLQGEVYVCVNGVNEGLHPGGARE